MGKSPTIEVKFTGDTKGLDQATDKAEGSLGKFKSAVSSADGVTGKFKAGASSAFDAVKANAGGFAIGAGAALVAFGAKAVGAFADLGIEAGKLSDSLGLPVEDASRLMEVAGDVGISVGDLESTIGKMNRTVAQSPDKFAALGAEIVKNKDGTVDVNETFLNTVDALNKIPDATERAAKGQEVFGKSWTNIAELVGQGSDKIRESMAAVSDAKVIDESEVEKARAYRAAMDRLNDSIEDITLAVGEYLIPALSQAADQLGALVEVAQKLKVLKIVETYQEWTNAASLLGKAHDVTTGKADLLGREIVHLSDDQWAFMEAARAAGISTDSWNAALDAGVTSMEDYDLWLKAGESSTEDFDAATAEASISAAEHAVQLGEERAALEKLTASTIKGTDEQFSLEKQTLALMSASSGLAQRTAETATIVDSSTSTDAEKSAALIALRQDQINVAEQSLKLAQTYASEAGAADGTTQSARLQVEKLRELQATYPENAAAIQPYITKLLQIPGVVDTTISADTRAANRSLDTLMTKLQQIGSGASAQAAVNSNRFRQYAGGTDYHPGGLAVVGEKGAELVNLPRGSSVATASETAAALAGGRSGRSVVNNTTIIQNYPQGVTPTQVMQQARQYERVQGPV